MIDDRPPLPEPLSVSLGTVTQAAVEMAKKWRLIDDQGQLWCSKDGCTRHGTYPSLLCVEHLAEHRRKNP